MIDRKEFEKREEELLASYAAKSGLSRGREHPEDECPFRTSFARDRARIIHCGAFRRLEYKTQVFVNHEGDYYRTRLTHSLEVAQLSKGIARTLGLNEDLAEAIALAHDLGHTPFGHQGEKVLNQMMTGHGGFEHNRQSHRVVTHIEHLYPAFRGLNLTHEVLEGIVKHVTEYDAPDLLGTGIDAARFPSLEAQVVSVADEIAYMNHDLDDGLESGMLDPKGIEEVSIWREQMDSVRTTLGGVEVSAKLAKYQGIRRLIDVLVTDLLKETERRIAESSIRSIDDVANHRELIVRLGDRRAAETKVLKSYLFNNLYRHYRVERMGEKATQVVTALFKTYAANIKLLPTSFQRVIREGGEVERTVCDYIAGMTDRYALGEYSKLFDPTAPS